jgi:hypothetical protein
MITKSEEDNPSRRRAKITNLVCWATIAVFIFLTIVVALWARHQPEVLSIWGSLEN